MNKRFYYDDDLDDDAEESYGTYLKHDKRRRFHDDDNRGDMRGQDRRSKDKKRRSKQGRAEKIPH